MLIGLSKLLKAWYEFLEGSILYKDIGYQGYEPSGVNTRQPKKKPRSGELTEAEKAENTLISKMRITVEHVICGVKRCGIVKDIFRNTKDGFDDLVMEIACGLHNFRTAYAQERRLIFDRVISNNVYYSMRNY